MRWQAALAAVAWMTIASGADTQTPAATASIPVGGPEAIETVPVPFGAGEKLRYGLSWLAIGAGEMVLEAEPPQPYRGREAYTLRLTATSNDFFARFFYLEDTFLSRVEATRFESMRYEKHTREGKKVRDEVTTFDLEKRITTHKGERIELPSHVVDTLSAIYYIRLLPLESGRRFVLDAHANGKNYKLAVNVLGYEEIEVPAGKIRAWKVEPKLAEGIFKKEGKMYIWFASDGKRTPVRIRTYLSLGHITAALLLPDQAAPVGEQPKSEDRPLSADAPAPE